jgi:flagellar biosynthetic protein FliP
MTKSARHFIRHYVEMVAAMFIGMGVLFAPALVALGAAGVSSAELRSDAPALLLLGMGVTMTAPMIAWMRYRRHGWAASNEMAASMLIPTVGVIALLGAGLVSDIGMLMTIEHVVMLPSMLIVMLLRRDQYSHAHAAADQVALTR